MRWSRLQAVCGVVLLTACGGGETLAPPADNEDPIVLRGTWTQAAQLPEAVVTGGAAVAGGKIYVVGGEVPGQSEASAKAFRYDPGADAWERLTDLPEGLWRPGVAAKGDTLLVLGGNLHSNGLSPRANVWWWNDGASEWVHHSDLPLPSSSPEVSGTSSGVFVAGLGSIERPPGDSTAFQSVSEAEWRYTAPAPMPVAYVSATGNEVWAVGLSGHARFDASTLTWSSLASLPTDGFIFGSWSVPGRRHLLTRLGTAVTHWVLEGDNTVWSNAASPDGLAQRSNTLTVAIGETLYLIGGTENGVPTRRVDVFSGY